MKQVKKYTMCLLIVLLLFLFLFTIIRLTSNKMNANKIVYDKASKYVNMQDSDDKVHSDINYPIFNIKNLDSEVASFVENYKNKKNVNIDYTVYVTKDVVNLFFKIIDNNVISYKDINYSIINSTFNIQDIFDFNIIGPEILEKVRTKYSTDIYKKVLENNFKDAYIKMQDNGTYIYFAPSLFNNIEYEVYVLVSEVDSVLVTDEVYDKVIAFTFDDGPSQYSLEVSKALLQNNSKATFFELGNRMKYNQEIVKELVNDGMEIASHTYAHKNLNKLSDTEIDEEVNSTNILFNEITGQNITLLRPPYGNAKQNVKDRIAMPLIMWNVDTEDWLHKDSNYVYNHILENAQDGDIILMHDIYDTTLEAIKMVLPVLKARGYKITTVSELASLKGVTLENGVSYRSFK